MRSGRSDLTCGLYLAYSRRPVLAGVTLTILLDFFFIFVIDICRGQLMPMHGFSGLRQVRNSQISRASNLLALRPAKLFLRVRHHPTILNPTMELGNIWSFSGLQVFWTIKRHTWVADPHVRTKSQLQVLDNLIVGLLDFSSLCETAKQEKEERRKMALSRSFIGPFLSATLWLFCYRSGSYFDGLSPRWNRTNSSATDLDSLATLVRM